MIIFATLNLSKYSMLLILHVLCCVVDVLLSNLLYFALQGVDAFVNLALIRHSNGTQHVHTATSCRVFTAAEPVYGLQRSFSVQHFISSV